MKNSKCLEDQYSFNDTLSSILSYCNVNTGQVSSFEQLKSKTESEAFSGGAWDEDDDRIELYENKTSLHLSSNRIESSNNGFDDILSLAFGNSAVISDNIVYPAPLIPSNYLPVSVIDESDSSLQNSIIAAASDQSLSDSQVQILMNDIEEKTASAALKGFMPFGEDPDKQTRYVKYLRSCTNKVNVSDNFRTSFYLDEKEREEFIMSAQIFKPSSSIISSRFESSSSSLRPQVQLKTGLSRPDISKKPVEIITLPLKVDVKTIPKKDPNPKRLEHIWVPNSLLCKRFNVSPPDTGLAASIELKTVKPVLADESIGKLVDVLVKESKFKIQFESSKSNNHEAKEDNIPHMPSEDLFDEIFGSSTGESQSKSRSRAIDYFNDD